MSLGPPDLWLLGVGNEFSVASLLCIYSPIPPTWLSKNHLMSWLFRAVILNKRYHQKFPEAFKKLISQCQTYWIKVCGCGLGMHMFKKPLGWFWCSHLVKNHYMENNSGRVSFLLKCQLVAPSPPLRFQECCRVEWVDLLLYIQGKGCITLKPRGCCIRIIMIMIWWW